MEALLTTTLDSAEDSTADLVIDSAIECLKQYGVQKTSIGDIASRSGFSRPTVYKYLKNKNAVPVCF